MSETAPAGAVRSGQAFVEFFAVDGKLNKSLTSIGNRLKAFGAFATKAGALLTAAGSGAAFGMFKLAEAAADAGSAVDDMSQRTGIAAKFISEMRYVTQMGGTSVEAFEKAVVSMSKALYGADEESKTAVKTLSNLGLSIKSLKGMSPDQAFLTISEALSKVEDPTRRTALAMKVFGKSGTDLIPMLSGGRAGIEDMMKAAERLGYSLSKEDAEAAAALGDQLDNVKLAIGGVVTQVGLAVSGPLAEWATWTKDQIPVATKWIKEHQGTIAVVAKIAAGLAIAGSALTAFGVATSAIGLGLTQVSNIGLGVAKNFGAVASTMKVLGIAAIAYGIGSAIKQWAGEQAELNRQLGITNRLNAELAMADNSRTQKEIDANKGKNSLQERRKDIDTKVAMAEKNLKGSATGSAMAQQNLKEKSGWWNTAVDMVWGSAEIDGAKQDLKEADERVETQRQNLQKLRDLQAEIGAEEEKVKAKQARKGQATRNWAGRVGQNLANSATVWGQGVSTQGVGLFEAAKEQLEGVQQGNADWKQKLFDDAKAIEESNKTPAQKRQERLDRLDQMRNEGAISNEGAALERAKIGLEAAQEKADKLEGRTQNRESLNLGISEDQKSLLAAQAGRMSVEDETRKNTGDAAKTLDEVLAEQRRLNAYLTANGISLVEVGGAA